jgi:hypothetical protein
VQVLHRATDQLNVAFLDAEQALRDLRLGVTASVLLDSDEEWDWYQTLEFCRSGKDFKLMVVSGRAGDDPGSFEATHITSASRETRLEAIKKLPELHAELLKSFHAEVERVQAGIGEVASFAQSLRKSGGK